MCSQREAYDALMKLGGQGTINQILTKLPTGASIEVTKSLLKLRKWGLIELAHVQRNRGGPGLHVYRIKRSWPK